MRRFVPYLLAFLLFVTVGFLAACSGGGGDPKNKADRSESDWSASEARE